MAAAEPRLHRSASNASKPSMPSMPQQPPSKSALASTYPMELEPCAATPSLFLYAQGPLILCLHHDTLALERRFAGHREPVSLICVDIVSERDAGRLVVSYDVGNTAIVWDLFTGDEKARFASYERITVAAWMRNGNVAFGNGKGEVILFEPSTSEHISARTIFDPITALAPASDCRTYAIGYRNGSILIAGLQPSFTILHTLTTSRAPSPIVSLAWHTSSSKQKSDMLATQTSDGDLRVWSVAKPPTKDIPRVIRALRRSDSQSSGVKWLAWSKNGRVVQYSERETWSWDVRTKHVTYEPVPTVAGVHGLACYGPTAALFSLGPNHTVQQYDLENPTIVANVRHLPLGVLAPPTPPDDPQVRPVEGPIKLARRDSSGSRSRSVKSDTGSTSLQKTTLEISAAENARQARVDVSSPISSSTRSGTASISSRSSGQGPSNQFNQYSPGARTGYSGTTFSIGSPQTGIDSHISGTSYASPSNASINSGRSRHRKGSRLRQEVLHSPEEKPLVELLPFTRARLHDLPFKPPKALDENQLTPENLRKQMLEVVFGWEGDIEELLREELHRHPAGSPNSVLLSKWLGEVDADFMASMLTKSSMSSSDWMFLALTQMGGQSSSKKIGEAFVQKMLEKGDIHAAATLLIGLGEQNDAIEVYVSRSYFMEAILLTCLAFPNDWQRQSYLVRRWGEHVVEHSQQMLAIRCFSCTGMEPSGPWTSPTAQLAVAFTEQAQRVGLLSPSHGPLLSPQGDLLSPVRSAQQFQSFPSLRPSQPAKPVQSTQSTSAPAPAIVPKKPSGPSRMTPQNSSLKLITTFGPPNQAQFKFPGLKSDDRTPTNVPGVTPIAESAINSALSSTMSPGGLGSYMRNNARNLKQVLNGGKAMTPGGYARHRLPSIGETPIDVEAPIFPVPKPLPTPADSGSDREKEAQTALPGNEKRLPPLSKENSPPLILSSARYEPLKESARDTRTPMTALTMIGPGFERSGSPQPSMLRALQESSRSRNGSRDRKPEGLYIIPPVESNANGEYSARPPDSPRTMARGMGSSNLYQTKSFDGGSEMSPPTTGHSYGSSKLPKSPGGISGRSIDKYISSLEEAHFYSRQHHSRRQASRDRQQAAEKEKEKATKSRTKPSGRDTSEDRGRSGRRYIPPSKRSPSSPIPMSPEDLLYSPPMESLNAPVTAKKATRGRSKPRSQSAKGSAPSKSGERKSSRNATRTTSRRASPEPMPDLASRGRSKSKRDGSTLRSPSSPLPMSPDLPDIPGGQPDFQETLRLVTVDRERLRSQPRSHSRRAHERGTSARRDPSPDRRRPRPRSSSRQATERSASRRGESAHGGNRDRSVDRRAPQENTDAGAEAAVRTAIAEQANAERTRKELAAAELEARRLSLARRPSAPPIPHPEEFSTRRPVHERARSFTNGSPTSTHSGSFSYRMMNRSKTSVEMNTNSDSNSSGKESGSVPYPVPGTPRAMRHPKYDLDDAPAVPDVPDDLLTLNDSVYRPPVIREAPLRSSSAPIPEKAFPDRLPPSPRSPPPVPADLPTHPAFQRAIPPSSLKARAFSPGRGREPSRERKVSPRDAPPGTLGYAHSPPGSAGIEERLSQNPIPDVPTLLPELQHLASPPPPPPPPIFHQEPSPATNMGIGMINIAMDDNSKVEGPRLGTPGIDMGTFSPSPAASPDLGRSAAHHQRGGSVSDGFSTRFKAMADKVRSPSRNRLTKSPPIEPSQQPSPYESVPSLEEQMQVRMTGQVPGF